MLLLHFFLINVENMYDFSTALINYFINISTIISIYYYYYYY